MTKNADDPLLTPEQTAAYLGVSASTLSWWRSEGRGPTPTKLGYRTIRYRKSAVEQYATSREQRADG